MVKAARVRNIGNDRDRVNEYLCRLLEQQRSSDDGCVHDAMCYAVLGSGQRVRPVLALRVARLLKAERPAVLRAASALELVHCASLIVDDLPCMDDERTRRDKPTVHVQYGEATAVLAAFALVALAARSLVEDVSASSRLDEREPLLAFQIQLLKVLDCSALIAGQALDLRMRGDRQPAAQRQRVAELKTVPLFRLAVQAGTLFANAGPKAVSALREFGTAFGAAFQTADDYLDGECFDADSLNETLAAARHCLLPFGEAAGELEGLLTYLHGRAQQADRCYR